MTKEEGRVIMELVVSGTVEYKDISFNLSRHKLYQKNRNVLLSVPPRFVALSLLPVAVSVKFPPFPLGCFRSFRKDVSCLLSTAISRLP